MNKTKSIVVAIDFSPCSADALRQAARLAKLSGATLRAVHVLDVPEIEIAPGALFPWPLPMAVDVEAAAKERWARFAPDCPEGKAAEFRILWGSPRHAILDDASYQTADLLVMGAHSTHDASRGIGTTAAACARRAKCRTLLVQPGASGPFKHIAVCVDFSDTSRIALEQGLRMAAQDNAALHIAHVFNDPWMGIRAPAEVQANMPDFIRKYRAGVEDRLRVFSAPFSHEINALKPTFHAVLHEETWAGHGEGLVRFFDAQNIDLAILGVRSKWTVRDAVMGSTAERVVRDAACSVLTVRPDSAR